MRREASARRGCCPFPCQKVRRSHSARRSALLRECGSSEACMLLLALAPCRADFAARRVGLDSSGQPRTMRQSWAPQRPLFLRAHLKRRWVGVSSSGPVPFPNPPALSCSLLLGGADVGPRAGTGGPSAGSLWLGRTHGPLQQVWGVRVRVLGLLRGVC